MLTLTVITLQLSFRTPAPRLHRKIRQTVELSEQDDRHLQRLPKFDHGFRQGLRGHRRTEKRFSGLESSELGEGRLQRIGRPSERRLGQDHRQYQREG
jgi:hypothetical protein